MLPIELSQPLSSSLSEVYFPPWVASAEVAECQAVLRALEASNLPKKLNVWNCCTNGSESACRRGIPTVGLEPGDMRDARIIGESIELS